MNNRSVRNGFTSLLIGSLALGAAARAQENARDRDLVPLGQKQPAASASKGGTAARSGKGPLPDPVLLDGSTLPAEKKSETGMLGDFELPGDENVRNNRVGGQQQMPGQQGGQQGQQGMQGMPPMAGGGAAGGPQTPQGQMPPTSAGGAAGPQNQQQNQQQAGAGGPAGPNDPNAKAEGMQVGNLQTDPSASGGDAGAAGADAQKPQQVAIGDQAMQIKGSQNAAGVVGGQVPAGATQQMESKVGGGKGSSAVSGGRNAAEKGRAIPSGL